jgi:heme/copper-type cytochrome/quinol oxidase subunit 4
MFGIATIQIVLHLCFNFAYMHYFQDGADYSNLENLSFAIHEMAAHFPY